MTNSIADWASIAISGASSTLAVIAFVYARRSQMKAEKATKRASELAEKQTRLSHLSWSDAYFRDVTSWAVKASEAISQAIQLAKDQAPPEDRISEVQWKLSNAIDIGRWYFPNRIVGDYGAHKEPAYQGVRQQILDHLVAAHSIVARPASAQKRSELVHCQRCFVSHVQLVLNPRERLDNMKKILSEFENAGGISNTIENSDRR